MGEDALMNMLIRSPIIFDIDFLDIGSVLLNYSALVWIRSRQGFLI